MPAGFVAVTPGIVLCIAITALASIAQTREEAAFGHAYVEALVIAILLGIAIRTLWQPGELWRAGISFSAKTLLEIAVVLLDMTMPEMNGEEAFRAMRGIRPDARVILSSGYSEEEATRAFTGNDLAGFLQKPYQLASLREKVDQVTGTLYEPELR